MGATNFRQIGDAAGVGGLIRNFISIGVGIEWGLESNSAEATVGK